MQNNKSFLADCTHANMDGHKRETYQTQPKNFKYPLSFFITPKRQQKCKKKKFKIQVHNKNIQETENYDIDSRKKNYSNIYRKTEISA